MTAKYVKTITTIFICVLLLTGHFLIANINLANDGSLENQLLKYEWDLEEQTVKNEWGLEEQTPKHDKSDSIILHYDGNSWTKQESNITHRLNRIWGSSHDNIYVPGDYGTVLHYNGKKWTKYNMSLYFI